MRPNWCDVDGFMLNTLDDEMMNSIKSRKMYQKIQYHQFFIH